MLPVPTTNPALYVRTRTHTTLSTNTQPTTTKKRQLMWMKTLKPDAKRPTRIPQPQHVKLPDEIGKYVVHDAKEVTQLGWTEFVCRLRGRGYFASLLEVKHPERRLLRQYNHCGAPVVLMTREWTEGERLAALKRGPDKSDTKHAPLSPRRIFLYCGEGAVVSAPLLGGQAATGTQVEPVRRKSGKG